MEDVCVLPIAAGDDGAEKIASAEADGSTAGKDS